MTFTRTASGVGNRNLFTGTVFTIYIEAHPDKDFAKGIDQGFWREFFSSYFNDLSIAFVPMGGKHHVLKTAEKIINDSIPNSLCALDSDYDDIFKVKLDDERIFYTHGYGVENDIFILENTESYLRALIPGAQDHQNLAKTINEYLYQTFKHARSCLIADQVCRNYRESLLDRKYPLSEIEIQNNILPVKIKKTKIKTRVKKIKSEKCTSNLICTNPLFVADKSLFPAHHYFEIFYHTIKNFLS